MSLKGSLDKLFFVLVYPKQHSLQSYYGFTFARSQSKVSQWLKVRLLDLQQKSGQKIKQLQIADLIILPFVLAYDNPG